jgi:hypothetical protein
MFSYTFKYCARSKTLAGIMSCLNLENFRKLRTSLSIKHST